MNKDVIIAGGGPAGATAAIYTARAGFKVKLFDPMGGGGQAGATDMIYNYPGFPKGVSGFQLMELMINQAKEFGTEVEFGEISSVSKQGKFLSVTSDGANYQTKGVIWAAGTSPRSLGVPGEEEFMRRGVSFCATCDGPLFKDKTVAVVGGGDSALTEAQFLTRHASKVILIHRRDQFRAGLANVNRVVENPGIILKLNSTVEQIKGDTMLRSIVIKDVESGGLKEIDVNGVFLYVGSLPNTKPLHGLVDLTPNGYVKVNKDMSTKTQGLFAAGDVREKMLRQVATAVGDGAIAAWALEKYIIENF